MGASSVTGVSGPGAAISKGPHNGRDTYVPLIGPRIIVAGRGVIQTGGIFDLQLQTPLPGGFNKYSYVCTPIGTDRYLISVGGAEDADGLQNLSFLTDPEHAGKEFSYAVISHGQAIV